MNDESLFDKLVGWHAMLLVVYGARAANLNSEDRQKILVKVIEQMRDEIWEMA